MLECRYHLAPTDWSTGCLEKQIYKSLGERLLSAKPTDTRMTCDQAYLYLIMSERSEISLDKNSLFLCNILATMPSALSIKDTELRLDSLGCLRLAELFLEDTFNYFKNLDSAVFQILTSAILLQKQPR